MDTQKYSEKANIKKQIEQKLSDAFDPVYLDVVDESHGHNVPDGAQTHFRATLVTPIFTDITRIQRHKQVYKVLDEELSNLIKALSVLAFTPSEWASKQHDLPSSPPCLGGSRHDK